MTTGERVRQRRKELGWTQDELAALAHVSRSTLGKVEADEAISRSFLRRIADALQVSLAELVSALPDPALDRLRTYLTGAGLRPEVVERAVALAARSSGVDPKRSQEGKETGETWSTA
jgi:transcriptional regulator with XRE-family HTH domain